MHTSQSIQSHLTLLVHVHAGSLQQVVCYVSYLKHLINKGAQGFNTLLTKSTATKPSDPQAPQPPSPLTQISLLLPSFLASLSSHLPSPLSWSQTRRKQAFVLCWHWFPPNNMMTQLNCGHNGLLSENEGPLCWSTFHMKCCRVAEGKSSNSVLTFISQDENNIYHSWIVINNWNKLNTCT